METEELEENQGRSLPGRRDVGPRSPFEDRLAPALGSQSVDGLSCWLPQDLCCLLQRHLCKGHMLPAQPAFGDFSRRGRNGLVISAQWSRLTSGGHPTAAHGPGQASSGLWMWLYFFLYQIPSPPPASHSYGSFSTLHPWLPLKICF